MDSKSLIIESMLMKLRTECGCFHPGYRSAEIDICLKDYSHFKVERQIMADLYFGGSVWCNIDIAVRHLEVIYKQETEKLGLTVIEWYVLQLLYEQDGQMASRLADGVGRPMTASRSPISRRR